MEKEKLIILTSKLERLQRETKWSNCDVHLVLFIIAITFVISTAITPVIGLVFFNADINDELWIGKLILITFGIGVLFCSLFAIYTNRTYKIYLCITNILEIIRFNKDEDYKYTKIASEISINLPKRTANWLTKT